MKLKAQADSSIETEPVITNQQVVCDKTPQVVASISNFHSQTITLSMDGTGDFTASFYDYEAGWKHSQPVSFENKGGEQSVKRPNVNVSSIAVDHNGSLYGIVSGGHSINRYAWNSSGPFTFTWQEDILTGL